VADDSELPGLRGHIGFVEVPGAGKGADPKLPGFQDNDPIV
jgi:hypothetical protein